MGHDSRNYSLGQGLRQGDFLQALFDFGDAGSASAGVKLASDDGISSLHIRRLILEQKDIKSYYHQHKKNKKQL
jgi:hypothetical protein